MSTESPVRALTGGDNDVVVGEKDGQSHTKGDNMTSSSKSTMIAGICIWYNFAMISNVVKIIISLLTATMQFSKFELQEATQKFSPSRLVGKGVYGSVYIGKNVRSGGTTAAVKVLNEVSIASLYQHILLLTL